MREGAAIVEFAITAPILVAIIFGTVDICSFFYLRQSLKVAAYQACRLGLTAGATESVVVGQAKLLLDSRSIKNYTVTCSSPPETLTGGEYFTVTVTAPTTSNVPLQGWFVAGKQASGQVSMMSEL